jgi:hypothetical protein
MPVGHGSIHKNLRSNMETDLNNMTMRDFFAALVVAGMNSRDVFDAGQARPEQRAKLAYIEADAMIEQRSKDATGL